MKTFAKRTLLNQAFTHQAQRGFAATVTIPMP